MTDKELSREVRVRIRSVLMEFWDPIGVADEPMAADEYYFYVGEIYELLRERASDQKVSDYFQDIEVYCMGLGDLKGKSLVPAVNRVRAVAALRALRF